MIPHATHVAVGLAAATVVWLGHSGVTSGHALLMESLPRADEVAPPSFSRVVLRFNSRIEKSFSRVSILSPSGGRVPLRVIGDGAPNQLIAAGPALATGSYTIEWQVLSADGHLTRGSFPFRVAPAP